MVRLAKPICTSSLAISVQARGRVYHRQNAVNAASTDKIQPIFTFRFRRISARRC